jgi:hypothetical protein
VNLAVYLIRPALHRPIDQARDGTEKDSWFIDVHLFVKIQRVIQIDYGSIIGVRQRKGSKSQKGVLPFTPYPSCEAIISRAFESTFIDVLQASVLYLMYPKK